MMKSLKKTPPIYPLSERLILSLKIPPPDEILQPSLQIISRNCAVKEGGYSPADGNWLA